MGGIVHWFGDILFRRAFRREREQTPCIYDHVEPVWSQVRCRITLRLIHLLNPLNRLFTICCLQHQLGPNRYTISKSVHVFLWLRNCSIKNICFMSFGTVWTRRSHCDSDLLSDLGLNYWTVVRFREREGEKGEGVREGGWANLFLIV